MSSEIETAALAVPQSGPLTPAQCWAALQARLVQDVADYREARDEYGRHGDSTGAGRASAKAHAVAYVLNYMDELERQS